jgi:hypothetical protein
VRREMPSASFPARGKEAKGWLALVTGWLFSDG